MLCTIQNKFSLNLKKNLFKSIVQIIEKPVAYLQRKPVAYLQRKPVAYLQADLFDEFDKNWRSIFGFKVSNFLLADFLWNP